MGDKMTKRRVKGEGSVYRRKDGRCMGEYVDANGKKRYVSGKTKPEVRQKLRKLLEDRDAGIAHDSKGLTVERYMDRWLESIQDKVRPGTYKPYEAIVRLHIKPTLGSTKLDKLTALQLEKLYRQKLNEGLSARRVRYIHVTVHKALKDAVRLQLLSRNVADAAIPPRPVKQEIEPLTQDQMRSLLDASKSDNYWDATGRVAGASMERLRPRHRNAQSEPKCLRGYYQPAKDQRGTPHHKAF
jgi:integrase